MTVKSLPLLKLETTFETGDAVLLVQEILKKKLPDPTLVVDGQFGPKTDAAVKKFQTAKGITVDGDVGPKTWEKLRLSI